MTLLVRECVRGIITSELEYLADIYIREERHRVDDGCFGGARLEQA